MHHGRRLILLALVAAPTLAADAAAQVRVNRRHTETLLAPFPQEVHDSAVISPDGRRIAYVRRTGAEQMVVLDGKPQKAYDQVASLTFSPNGKWLAYAASQGGDWFIVDVRQRAAYRRVGPPVFGPEGARIAYVALLPDGNRVVVVNDRPGRPQEQIFDGSVVLSPDGKRVAYGARAREHWYVVAGAAQLGPYDFLGSGTGIRFSPQGSRLAFAVWDRKRQKWYVVVDGTPQKPYDNIADLVFSSDGKQLAYAALAGDKWRVVADGKEQHPCDAVGEGTLQFSPDGTRLAYAVRSGGKWRVVAGDRQGKPYDGVAEMRFSPDGRHLAYAARVGSGEMVVLDGNEGRIFDRVGGGTLAFSPDSHRLGYAARVGRVWFVVIDGRRKRRYEMVGYLGFTPDSRHYVYAATEGNHVFTVVDEKEAVHRYDAVWNAPGAKFFFDSRKKFHYLAVKEDDLYLVEEEAD